MKTTSTKDQHEASIIIQAALKDARFALQHASDTASQAGLADVDKHCRDALRSLTEAELECPSTSTK